MGRDGEESQRDEGENQPYETASPFGAGYKELSCLSPSGKVDPNGGICSLEILGVVGSPSRAMQGTASKPLTLSGSSIWLPVKVELCQRPTAAKCIFGALGCKSRG